MISDLMLALIWYILFTLFGAVVLPLSMKTFRRMPEAGLLLSRPLGWLAIAFFSWLLAFLGILPFSALGLISVMLLLIALSVYLIIQNPEWFLRILRRCWRTALHGEIITILVFLLILLARREDPNIDSTEKPMDMMFLNALTVTREIPPDDPWLAGYPINYHYGGYLLHSIPVKLTGIPPEYAYNLAIAMVAALSASVAFVLGRILFQRCRWAVLTVIGTLFLGNLAGITVILRDVSFPEDIYSWRNGLLWNTSRIITDVEPNKLINEYPFFAILWGDLHPHFSNMPFFLFLLAIIYAISRAFVRLPFGSLLRYEWPLLATAVIGFAFIMPTNLFDFPVATLFFFAVLASGFLRLLLNKNVEWRSTSFLGIPLYTPQQGIRTSSLLLKFLLLAIPLIGYLFAAPFWLNFQAPLQGDLLHLSPYHTSFWEFFLIFGFHLIASLVILCQQTLALRNHWDWEEIGFFAGILGILFIALWTISGYIPYALTPVIALLFWLFTLKSILENHHRQPTCHGRETFALLACALAWSAIAGCEFIFIRDTYGEALSRMNTIFKFHFSAWLLLGVGLPYLLLEAFRKIDTTEIKAFLGVPLAAVTLLVLFMPVYILASLFILPTPTRSATLDGLAFMKQSHPIQYEIIQYVRENTDPDDVVLEIPGCAYSLENSVSAFTGRPTAIGWTNHESLWRGRPNEVEDPEQIEVRQAVYKRKEEILRLYTTQDLDEAKSILKKYNVKYVSYFPPVHTCDVSRRTPQIQQGLIRNALEPIFDKPSQNLGYELYRVPANFY